METQCLFDSITDDVLHNVLSRLPATSFAFASCVSRCWSGVCKRILSRPKILSAFSLNPDSRRAAEEALDKVLSEPIRPDFVIANVADDAHLEETLKLIVNRVGHRVPIVVSLVGGIIGMEASTGEFREVKLGDYFDCQTYKASDNANSSILVTIGYMPGLKVDVIPAIQSKEEPMETMGDRFVAKVRTYVAAVSDHAAPLGIILFGGEKRGVRHVIEKLDRAMPKETVLLGDERDLFLYRSVHVTRKESLYSESRTERKLAAGLVFARDRNAPSHIGEINFHTAVSSGLSAIGPRYKVVSVEADRMGSVSILTARREGHQGFLDGPQILDEIIDELENHTIESPTLYIGVEERRRYAVGSEKPKMTTSLTMREVFGGNEPCLTVEGVGIRTGDRFCVYYSDPKTAVRTVNDVSSQLQRLKTDWNSSCAKTEAFGGFIFSCCGRASSFSGQTNIDSSPFLENFPGLPFGGIFCCGEIGRIYTRMSEEDSNRGQTCLHQCLHFYSTVFLLMTYTTTSASSSD